ncbi:MAG: hypothetical protein L3J36_04565 [Rhodobacteraceae bacterium]|nr:hypothetical protein [Paracoccaceae bacterium]
MTHSLITRLTDGPHMGILDSFEFLGLTANGTDRQLVADDLRAQSVDAGMTISRVLIDWSDLEISKGVYDRAAIEDALDYAERQGMSPFVTLSTLDSEGRTLPAFLDGKALDSAEVSEAWVDLLEWLVPILKERGVWALSMGNEIGIVIEEGAVSEQEALNFYTLGAETIKALDPDMATTITFSAFANDLIPDLLPDLVDQLDIVAFNYAGLDAGLKTQTKAEWAAMIELFKQTAGDKEIIIQELGAPAGYGDAGADAPPQPDGLIDSSPGYQTRFLKYMMKQFAYDDQLRAAVIFQLYDWSPELAHEFAQPLHDAGFPNLADKLEEWLATTGMVRWSDATPRKVWQRWLDGLNLTEAVREDDFGNDLDSGASLDFTATGEISYRRDADWLEYSIVSSGLFLFELESDDTTLGALTTPKIKVYDANGDLLTKGYASNSGGQIAILDLAAQEQVYLAVTGGNPSDLGGWSLTAYRLIQGSSGADNLTGTNAGDYMRGAGDDDRLTGGRGPDKIFGGTGDDKLFGGLGRDILFGGGGNDRLLGGKGADLALGQAGNDLIIGHAGNDILSGGVGRDILNGGNGNDILSGGKDGDVLQGGTGLDVMTGGDGADVFLFTSALLDGSSSVASGLAEQITDFKTNRDLLDFSTIDANNALSGDQSFLFLGAGYFSGAGGELRFADGQLFGDVDGDSQADFTIAMNGVSSLSIDSLIL